MLLQVVYQQGRDAGTENCIEVSACWYYQFATQCLDDIGIIHGIAPPVLARTSPACSSVYFVVNCRTVSISDTLLMTFLFLSSYSAGMRAAGFQSIARMARFCSSLPISNMPGSGNSLCSIKAKDGSLISR